MNTMKMKDVSTTGTAIFGNKSALDCMFFAGAHWLKTDLALACISRKFQPWWGFSVVQLFILRHFLISFISGIKYNSEINHTQAVW